MKTKIKPKPTATTPLIRPKVDAEILADFVEKSKHTGVVTYEDVMEFIDKHHMTDQETDELLRTLDKENVEMITQEELEDAQTDIDTISTDEENTSIKSKISSPLEVDPESEEDDEEHTEKEAMPTQITDSVKSYLRDIGKIPLL